MLAILRSFRFVSAVAAVLFIASPALAQAPSDAAIVRSDAIASKMKALSEAGDAAGARRMAEDASRKFEAEGEAWLSASYLVSAVTYAMLLVLSACETGRGDEAFVGGVRGLPTAASLAGARRALLTLWPVSDRGTADFMVLYYEHLKTGQTYAEALRSTRREAIDGRIETAADPSVWAGRLSSSSRIDLDRLAA